MIFHFDKRYLLLTVLFFAVEIIIALFFTDKIIRPFVGDVLVVILIYCFARIFLASDYRKIAAATLIFACFIELCQYFDYVKILGLENNRPLSILMGRTFEPLDFIAYCAGFLIVLLCEKIFDNRKL